MRDSTKRHFREVDALPEPAPVVSKPGKVTIAVLASGSKGNCLVVSHAGHSVMVDAGITPSEAARRARSIGFQLTQLDAVLVTHWHKDHTLHVNDMCREFRCPMASSKATAIGMESQPAKMLRAVPGEALEVGEFVVHPIKVDHEEGSLAYHLHVGGKNILVAHDLAQPNSTLLAAARAADALLIEANYDAGLLATCTDPNHAASLHARVASQDRGHLANLSCSEVVSHVDPEKIQVVCALHISSSHNTPVLAEEAIRAGLPPGARPAIYTARQDSALLLEVNGGPEKIELPLIDQFRRLDRKVDAIIHEQKVADAETAERRVVMGEHLAAMRELFAEKEPDEKLDGFEFFDHWKASKAQAYGVSERTMNYYLLDAETVVPIIGREEAIKLPLGTISELGKLAKAKGEIPAATLQFAKEHGPAEVKAHVASILYPGKTGHFDGPEDFLSVKAGKAQIAVIRTKLDVARGYADNKASDADLIEWALEEFIQGQKAITRMDDEDAAETHAAEAFEVVPVPPPPDFDTVADLLGADEGDIHG